jgi:hypothetical protein
LNEVAVRLRAEIGSVRGGYNFSVQGATMDVPWLHNFQAQLRYMPNPKLYHVTAQLTLTTERTASLLVSIHGLGKEFRGLLAASAFLLGADEGAVVVVSDDFLQLNYREDKEKAQERFVPWLESAIVKGLTLWREQL